MKRNDPTFKEMVSRIDSGELTRKQASELYGIGYGTLGVWLQRSAEKKPRLYPTRRPSSEPTAAKVASEIAPRLEGDRLDALNAAVARVLAGKSTSLAESKANPDVKLSTLTIKVRKERELLTANGDAQLTTDMALMKSVMRDAGRLSKVAAVVRAAGL